LKRLLRASVNALPLKMRHWIKHIPGVAAGQRWLIRFALSGEPFVHTINAGPVRGLRFEITLPDDKAIWAGTFEPEFSQALHETVRHGDVCYDIGGYRGYMAGVFALSGASRVFVFEPLPENVNRLRQLAKLNPALPLQIEELAVGRSDGTVYFKVMAEQSMGKLSDSAFQMNALSSREILVHLVCLDTWVFKQKQPRPAVIKIDVEGAEVDVLDGAMRTLKECHPRILIEAHSEKLAALCTQKLSELGYQICQLEEGLLNPEDTRHLIAKFKA
jgi:FkbM family methyltransferase